MKLFTRYSRVNLVATIIIFLFASLAFYFVLHYILVHQVDEDLKIEQQEIETYTQEHNILPESVPVKDQVIFYKPAANFIPGRQFSTALLPDPVENEIENQRVLIFYITIGSENYQVHVSKSLERTDKLVKSILLITSLTILVILIVSYLINRFLLKRLWKPFYSTLLVMKNFRVDKQQEIKLSNTNIDEFAFMNEVLDKVTSQAKTDYISLKEFTENASHEMQTPLAILRSKLDLFIQNENLSREQSELMQGAYYSIDKLARLNHSLLLLAKIENNQFADAELVDLRQKLMLKLASFHELWLNQGVSVQHSLEDIRVSMNNELSEVMLNNLLSNATRHNYLGGTIEIELRSGFLRISNTSRNGMLDQQRLFTRFYKEGSTESNGLGLSIIKQICEMSSMQIKYSFADNLHHFTISWQRDNV